ncbi:hypothetical protein [Mycolicibacterium llatzerense]|uniref:hypothetical protein n=1 Tax=Mycolicibacterium llatzerense TaxID=280871 RepID=UPI0008DC5C2B|nr:hypothetical protein [Mycolicibacterium llatzerense]
MTSPLVAVELTGDERDFIDQILEQWALSAASKPFPFQALGLSTWDEFGELTVRLGRAVVAGEALTELDWARVLFLAEVTWVSSLIGTGLDSAIMTRFPDVEAIQVLRGLQRKIGGTERARLLFPNGGRTRTPEELAAMERWGEDVGRRSDREDNSPGG